MSAYDACRLLALNFYSFVKNPFTKEAIVDYDLLYKMAYEQQRLADNLIDLELEHIDRIIDKINQDPEEESIKRGELELWQNIRTIAESSRRTGCGFTALGDMLAALGLKYDSKEAMETIQRVMRTKMSGELDCTIDLAMLRGSFKDWDANEEFKIDGDIISGRNDFYQFLAEEFYLKVTKMIKWGRRNVSWSTVAPTGSVSILTQTTSGLEPLFAPFYMRRKKVNPGETGVRVDFTDQNGDNWMEYPVLHPKFKDWLQNTYDFKEQLESGLITKVEDFNKATIESLFQQSPWYGSTANDINWKSRVYIQSIIQNYTTHSISSTINLPNEISTEEVDTIYMTAFDANLKGVTVKIYAVKKSSKLLEYPKDHLTTAHSEKKIANV